MDRAAWRAALGFTPRVPPVSGFPHFPFMSGILYVVATPLGNLGDLSVRASEVLCSVAVVAAEDTRRTRRLLNHLDASPRLISLPAFAEAEKAGKIIALLEPEEQCC